MSQAKKLGFFLSPRDLIQASYSSILRPNLSIFRGKREVFPVVSSEYFGHAICVEFLLGYFPSPTRINGAQNKG